MQVSSWKFMVKSEEVTDKTVFGLMLGKANCRQFFDTLEQVSVEIDGNDHVFSLARENFWTTCPELRDTNTEGTPIRDWLEKHDSLTWRPYKPSRFELEPLGNGRFRLAVQR